MFVSDRKCLVPGNTVEPPNKLGKWPGELSQVCFQLWTNTNNLLNLAVLKLGLQWKLFYVENLVAWFTRKHNLGILVRLLFS